MKPRSIVKASFSTLASAATQFVVHEAFEMMWWASGSYASSLTPRTSVRSGSLAGAEMITFFAPASRCFCTLGRSVKNPVDSSTTSTPRSPQGSCAGSRSARPSSSLPAALIDPLSTVTPPSSGPSSESYASRCAIVGTSPRSLNATSSKSVSRSSAARKKLRPMRPKPLMPTRVFAMPTTLDGTSPRPRREPARSRCGDSRRLGDALRRPLRGRDLHEEGRALAVVRLDPDASVEPVDELTADVETEAGAPDAARHVRIEAIELLEDAPALGCRDAEPAVADRPQHVVVPALDADVHGPAVRRVLDGVLDEVDEHLAQLLLVGAHGRKLLRRGEIERDAFREVGAGGVDDARGDHSRVDGLDRQLEPPGVEVAREQEVVDDLGEAAGLVLDDLEQPVARLVADVDVLTADRDRGAVDRGQRRAQLVRDGRDEVGAHLLEGAVLGQVAEREDRSLVELDRREREPELAALDLDRHRLRARAVVRHPLRRLGVAGKSFDGLPADDLGPRQTGDRLCRLVPELHDAFAVEQHDPVCDRLEREGGARPVLGFLVQPRALDRERRTLGERPRDVEVPLVEPPPGLVDLERDR